MSRESGTLPQLILPSDSVAVHSTPPETPGVHTFGTSIAPVLAVASILLNVCLAFVQHSPQVAQHARTPEYTFRIVREYPHDSAAFTQGLAYRGGFLYEGTGLKGRSSVRKVRLETGEVVQRVDLPPEYFGEGITLFKNEIVQLTWQAETGFIYDATDFRLRKRFSYKGEGWGLATDGHELFMSDGTEDIRVLDPATFTEKRRLRVHDGTTSIPALNELEFVDGQILRTYGTVIGSRGFLRKRAPLWGGLIFTGC